MTGPQSSESVFLAHLIYLFMKKVLNFENVLYQITGPCRAVPGPGTKTNPGPPYSVTTCVQAQHLVNQMSKYNFLLHHPT